MWVSPSELPTGVPLIARNRWPGHVETTSPERSAGVVKLISWNIETIFIGFICSVTLTASTFSAVPFPSLGP